MEYCHVPTRGIDRLLAPTPSHSTMGFVQSIRGETMRTIVLLTLALTTSAAFGQDAYLPHQGRLLDAVGAPIQGDLTAQISLYSDVDGTTAVWRKAFSPTSFDNGYYAVTLTGTDDSARMLDDVLDTTLWLGVAIDGGADLQPLQRVSSIVDSSISSGGDIVLDGTVTIGDSTGTTCTGTNEGEIRWTGSNFEGCTGSAWVVLARGGVGQEQSNPALSCQDITDTDPTATSGPYWIDPDGTNSVAVFRTWCEISGGEGWTLFETVASGFQITSTYWGTASISPTSLASFGSSPNGTARLTADQINALCRGGIGEVRHKYGNNSRYVTDQFDPSILQGLDIAYAVRGDSTYHMGFRGFGNGSTTVTSGGPWRRYNGAKTNNLYCTEIHGYCGGGGVAYAGWGPLCDTQGCNISGERNIGGNFWWAGSNAPAGTPSGSTYGGYGTYGSRWCR